MNKFFYFSFCLLFLITIITPTALSANLKDVNSRLYFKSLGIDEGLSQNTVNYIIQDKTGFMWFGTKDGLNRYDGTSFTIYKKNKTFPTSLNNSFIRSLYQDQDLNLWIGTDAGISIYNPVTESFQNFDMRSKNSNQQITNAISSIYGDSDNTIWIASERQGLFRFHKENKELIHYAIEKYTGGQANIECISKDKAGSLWLGTFGDGLFVSTDNMNTVNSFRTNDGRVLFEDDVITKISEGPYNCLYVSSVEKGLIEINLSSREVREILRYDEQSEHIYIRDFLFIGDNIWVGTETGLFIYNISSRTFTHHRSSMFDPYAISDNAIYTLCKDREGGVWIGTYFGGVNYYPPQYTKFEKYYPLDEGNSIRSKRVREFAKAPDGSIWIGTEDGGLNNYNPKDGIFKFLSESEKFKNIHGLCIDGEKLWVGTFMNGLKLLDLKSGKIKSYNKTSDLNSIGDNNIFTICKTKEGTLFFGTLSGMYKYNRAADSFTDIPELNNKFIYDIKEDYYGDLWVATYANGVFRYLADQNKWVNYLHDVNDNTSLPYNKVISIYEDSKNEIWITTQGGGFCRFDRKNNCFERKGADKGLLNEVVYQMQEDNQGFYWLTTNRGLIQYDMQYDKIKIYTTSNGLLTNQFNYQSSLKDDDGKLYFGSIEGFVAFDPSTFITDFEVEPITITDFLLFNKKAIISSKDSPLEKSITFSDTINLSAAQNSFSLKLAVLDYASPEATEVSYMLEGFDKEYHRLIEGQLITYSNLSHGTYIFKAKSSDVSGFSNQVKSLVIHIDPPIYKTVWAYILYVILFFSVAFFIFNYFRQRHRDKRQRELEKFEQMKELEIYNVKIEFFTNLAHDIRTPLTLIKGPLDSVLAKYELPADVTDELGIMKKNTNRLLNLLNQLLDFRKTETQGFKLNFTKVNISELLRETYQRFSLAMKNENIDFQLLLPKDDFYADVDKEALTKIISNLFSNAVKYTDSYIKVELIIPSLVEPDHFIIKFQNDGDIIPKEFRSEIFKPFVEYNSESNSKSSRGTGIGLPLSRSLAELHQGDLFFEDVYDSNVFILKLPSEQDYSISLAAPIQQIDQEENSLPNTISAREEGNQDTSCATVLLIEDNVEMLSFVRKQFETDYEVLTAKNGQEALQLLDAHYVDLIVSDIVMPVMDGFEFCKKIKSDISYSHIPIILLTARTNIQSKIEGLELGADAYIEKPFSIEYLLATASNLIENRKTLRNAFANMPFTSSESVAHSSADKEFLKSLDEIIQKNYQNPAFSMDDMAEELNMSRASFYRKIKGVIDMSPNDYLRLERLKKAAILLKENKLQISEICYIVGFSSPSYFSKCFQKQFGVSPKDFK